MDFKRKFSMSMYKNLSIKIGEMTFLKDFVNDKRGDLYPIAKKSDDCLECVENNEYVLKKGSAERLICQFFPFATFELSFAALNGEVGFSLKLPETEAYFMVDGKQFFYSCEDHKECHALSERCSESSSLVVSCRPGALDIYCRCNDKPDYVCTVYEEKFKESNQYETFTNGYAFLCGSGSVTVKKVVAYIDNGVSMADIRPMKYEDGSVLMEGGKLYFTASIRIQEGSYQGMFAWIPGTSEISMTGVLFYDCGDGKWRNYIAPVILFNREKRLWYVWVSSFEHKHILAYASFEGDPRFGVNVVDVQFMKEGTETSDFRDFVGFKGDEDPDLLYDKENDRWLLAICRIDPKTRGYVYLFFESHDPFEGFRYIGQANPGEETGGSFVRIQGELHFICGNGSKVTSEYRIYNKNGMRLAKFNYPDGGYRGWGCVFPVTLGSRTRYFFLTFDRHNGSAYNWSYGNVYGFEVSNF